MPRAFPEARGAGEQQTRSRAADELRRGLGPGAPPAGLERSPEERGLPGGTREEQADLWGGYSTGAEGSRSVAPQVRPHPHANGQTDGQTDSASILTQSPWQLGAAPLGGEGEGGMDGCRARARGELRPAARGQPV